MLSRRQIHSFPQAIDATQGLVFANAMPRSEKQPFAFYALLGCVKFLGWDGDAHHGGVIVRPLGRRVLDIGSDIHLIRSDIEKVSGLFFRSSPRSKG